MLTKINTIKKKHGLIQKTKRNLTTKNCDSLMIMSSSLEKQKKNKVTKKSHPEKNQQKLMRKNLIN